MVAVMDPTGQQHLPADSRRWFSGPLLQQRFESHESRWAHRPVAAMLLSTCSAIARVAGEPARSINRAAGNFAQLRHSYLDVRLVIKILDIEIYSNALDLIDSKEFTSAVLNEDQGGANLPLLVEVTRRD